MNRHVHNLGIYIFPHFKTMLYKLHGNYLATHETTTVPKIVEELGKLQPPQVCHMYNKTFTPHHPFH